MFQTLYFSYSKRFTDVDYDWCKLTVYSVDSSILTSSLRPVPTEHTDVVSVSMSVSAYIVICSSHWSVSVSDLVSDTVRYHSHFFLSDTDTDIETKSECSVWRGRYTMWRQSVATQWWILGTGNHVKSPMKMWPPKGVSGISLSWPPWKICRGSDG